MHAEDNDRLASFFSHRHCDSPRAAIWPFRSITDDKACEIKFEIDTAVQLNRLRKVCPPVKSHDHEQKPSAAVAAELAAKPNASIVQGIDLVGSDLGGKPFLYAPALVQQTGKFDR